MVRINIDDRPVGEALLFLVSGFPRKNIARVRVDGDLLDRQFPCILNAAINREPSRFPIPL